MSRLAAPNREVPMAGAAAQPASQLQGCCKWSPAEGAEGLQCLVHGHLIRLIHRRRSWSSGIHLSTQASPL